jgi:hypothetical protein
METLFTGSSGLIGSEVALHLVKKLRLVHHRSSAPSAVRKRDFQPLMDTYRESPIHLRPKGFGGTSSRFHRYCQKGMRDGNRHGRWPGSPEEWGIPSELGVTHPCGLPGWTCPAPPRMPLQSARPSRTICRGHYPGIISAHKRLKFSPAPSNIQLQRIPRSGNDPPAPIGLWRDKTGLSIQHSTLKITPVGRIPRLKIRKMNK